MPDITLLTFHGTLLCYGQGGNGFRHRAVSKEDPQRPQVRLRRDETGSLGIASINTAPALTDLLVGPGLYAGTVSLRQNLHYASAKLDGNVNILNRRCLKWESFLPLDADALSLLRHILASSWMLPGIGLVTPAAIRLAAGFSLFLGRLEIDLLRGLPRAVENGRDRVVLTPRRPWSGTVTIERIRPAARLTGRPTIHIVPRGNTANRALQYLTAEAMRAALPEAEIENVQLPEWDGSRPSLRRRRRRLPIRGQPATASTSRDLPTAYAAASSMQ